MHKLNVCLMRIHGDYQLSETERYSSISHILRGREFDWSFASSGIPPDFDVPTENSECQDTICTTASSTPNVDQMDQINTLFRFIG